MKKRERMSIVEALCSSARSNLRREANVSLLIAVLSSSLFVGPSYASEIPEWPHEQEARLDAVESELVDLHRNVLRARMLNDEAQLQELEKRKKELEQEQVKLLRATGKFPSR